jgi:hypothetical protein
MDISEPHQARARMPVLIRRPTVAWPTRGDMHMADGERPPDRGHATVVERRPAPLRTDDGDHERFAHYIFVPDRNAEAVVLEARVTGTPVTALCGKR